MRKNGKDRNREVEKRQIEKKRNLVLEKWGKGK
jgi:hypothetical protein